MASYGGLLTVIIFTCFLTNISPAKGEIIHMLGPTIGIDLGSLNSCVGFYRNGTVEIMPNDQGQAITPSWVAFSETEILIGEDAKNYTAINAKQAIFDINNFLGKRFDPIRMKRYPFMVVEQDEKPVIQVELQRKIKLFRPEEIAAIILKSMKGVAEKFLKTEVSAAVITVPAYFNNAQKAATNEAGKLAGFSVLKILNQPIAAATAYGLDKGSVRNILVFELSDQSLEVSVLAMGVGISKVLATYRDTSLGGEMYGDNLMKYYIKMIKGRHGMDIVEDEVIFGKLKKETSQAILALTSLDHVLVETSLSKSLNFSNSLTRGQFKKLNLPVLKHSTKLMNRILDNAKIKKKQIDDILLVGRITKHPMIQQVLKDFFEGKKPMKYLDPDVIYAMGAALQAKMLEKVHFVFVAALFVVFLHYCF